MRAEIWSAEDQLLRVSPLDIWSLLDSCFLFCIGLRLSMGTITRNRSNGNLLLCYVRVDSWCCYALSLIKLH